ncbi:endonuclease [Streptomonospora sp. S1-112]|uniref:Endonuclease n=1 Tax=Streptomonospora mangrovi TaxID=2883123 RepID=A0A9X3NPJ1_9ACTN|nr:endonuclease [Streptomonospora mangrovi]MDA0565584.1 endonuclease [Streptomonospora mangrovi]
MAAAAQKRIARAVLEEAGQTLAGQAGVRLADRPAPLWQLLVVVNLVSARISADIAVAAARELFAAGGTTPAGMAGLSWQERVDALGRGRYVRYDESTATRLGECADLAGERYGGDLRRMGAAAEGRATRLAAALQGFPGIGPTGAAVFCREAQAVWPWLRPYADRRARGGAARLGLPSSAKELAALVGGEEMAALTAGLVRASRDADVARRVRAAA